MRIRRHPRDTAGEAISWSSEVNRQASRGPRVLAGAAESCAVLRRDGHE